MRQGVDYAFGKHPDPAVLAAQGKEFACRYGGPGTADKWLTPFEADSLSAAGISVVANAEGAANGLLGGWDAGRSWAFSAEHWFRGCGMPVGRPIYFSVDFDVNSAQWPTVASALRGAASVLGLDRVGVYGGRRAIEWARRDGVASWFWQTYAWSGGVWVPGNHIEQYKNGVDIDGADCDLNRAPQADYGQWKTGTPGQEYDDMPKLISKAGSPAVWLSYGPGFPERAYGVQNQHEVDELAKAYGPVVVVDDLAVFGLPPKDAPVPPIPPVPSLDAVTRAEVIAAFEAAKHSLESR